MYGIRQDDYAILPPPLRKEMTEIDILTEAAEFLDKHIIIGWTAQGHHNTGAWENSLQHSKESNSEVVGTAASYGAIVNAGVAGGNIPYGGAPTGAKTSQYIQGLYNFFKSKGKSDKDALSFAFATAKKQKQEGMSTNASRLFSSTGERQHFLDGVIEAIGYQLDNMIPDGLNSVILAQVNEPQTQTI